MEHMFCSVWGEDVSVVCNIFVEKRSRESNSLLHFCENMEKGIFPIFWLFKLSLRYHKGSREDGKWCTVFYSIDYGGLQ